MTQSNEFLAAMFAAYMGCEVQFTTYYGTIHTAKPATWTSDALQSSNYSDWYPVSRCKPILVPLSDISEEDVIDVVSIGGWCPQNQGKLLKSKFDLNSNEFIAEFEISKYRVCVNAEVVDYWRSKSYDAGFRSIPSLIDAGLAIQATKQ